MQTQLEAAAPTIECTDDLDRFSLIAEELDEQVDETEPGSVFRSPAWLLPWWRRLSIRNELAAYVVSRDARSIAVLPAYRTEMPFGGTCLRLLGDGVVTSDFLGPVAVAGEGDEVAPLLARFVLEREENVLFEGLPRDGAFANALAAEARSLGRASERVEAVCPYLDVAAHSLSDWWEARPDGVGVQVRRRRRWLERRPGFGIERLDVETDVVAGMTVLWQLHRARWARAGGSRALPSEAVERFHVDAAAELARRGWARLYLLHAEGAPRAALYGFERGGRFAYYQMGHDPSFSQRSVGTVLLATAIEDAFDNGLREFDFLRGLERYKLNFASSARALTSLRIAGGVVPRLSLFAHRGYSRAGAVLRRRGAR